MSGFGLYALVVSVAYLLGAIPFGYLVARARGVDIFRHGSGNIGATNVGRVLGRRFGLLVFVLDFAKGAVPVAGAGWLGGRLADAGSLDVDGLRIAAGLSAFIGHLFPIYLGFRGGKGVATGAGVVTVLLPGPTLAAFLAWLAVVCSFRYVSLASLTAALVLCLARFALTPDAFASEHRTLTVFCLVAVGLVAWRHHSNVRRLRLGTENRLPENRVMHLLGKTLHVLALGLWFGSAVFFSLVAAPLLFRTFEGLGTAAIERPPWLHLPSYFDKELGTRLAGVAVSPMFSVYFLLSGACALLATITALGWSWAEPTVRVHRLRVHVLITGLATVLVGWWLAQRVSDLRVARYVAEPDVAEAAQAAFAGWHLASLLLNFVTIALAGLALALTAQLPASPAARCAPAEPKASVPTANPTEAS
ncbi:MAG: glycerol-3-phosphate 1-O-acyltransferase PlsY [Gemmataceae bacterium]|nr:glycerol-3-phosphate 1-O-acyltransferase PlsY [Gemmataceae bacterium]